MSIVAVTAAGIGLPKRTNRAAIRIFNKHATTTANHRSAASSYLCVSCEGSFSALQTSILFIVDFRDEGPSRVTIVSIAGSPLPVTPPWPSIAKLKWSSADSCIMPGPVGPNRVNQRQKAEFHRVNQPECSIKSGAPLKGVSAGLSCLGLGRWVSELYIRRWLTDGICRSGIYRVAAIQITILGYSRYCPMTHAIRYGNH
jgi:hypothetical protein